MSIASLVGVVLIKGRKCGFRDIIRATLSWLWWMIAIAMTVYLLMDEETVFSIFFAQVPIGECTYEELLLYTKFYVTYTSWISAPTAILGAFTYSDLRAWLSRNKSKGIIV